MMTASGCAASGRQRTGTIGHFNHLVAEHLQQFSHHGSGVGVVFYIDQLALPGGVLIGGYGLRESAHQWQWQEARLKSAALSDARTGGFNVAAMQAHQLPDQRQTNAQSALQAVGGRWPLHEGVKHAGQQFGRHADARILNRHDGLARNFAHRDLDFAARPGKLQRVGQQVVQDRGRFVRRRR